MMGMWIRELLNKILWDPREDPKNYEIVILHRGAYRGRKVISADLIKRVDANFLIYEDENGDEVYIPLHRVLEVRKKDTGEITWSKRY